MKLRLFPFSKQILFFTLIIFMFGCDQDDTPDYNYFKVGDKEYKIEKCVIFKYFENDTSGLFDLGFYFNQLEYWRIDSLNLVSTFPIQKNGIFFRGGKFSKVIRQGDYYFGEFISNPGGYGYGDANEFFNYNGATYLGTGEADSNMTEPLIGGELSIKAKGENFIIEFNCLTIGNSKVMGYYSGVPIVFEFKKKSKTL